MKIHEKKKETLESAFLCDMIEIRVVEQDLAAEGVVAEFSKVEQSEERQSAYNSMQYNYIPWNDEDSKELYEAYEEDETFEIVTEQIYIPAQKIVFTYEEFADIEFPWHSRPKEDFVELLEELKRLMDMEYPSTEEDVIDIMKEFPNAYEEFYNRPIMVNKDEERNVYWMAYDGRHRIFVAAEMDMDIPVWVVKYITKNKIALEEYLEKSTVGCWRFFEKDKLCK